MRNNSRDGRIRFKNTLLSPSIMDDSADSDSVTALFPSFSSLWWFSKKWGTRSGKTGNKMIVFMIARLESLRMRKYFCTFRYRKARCTAYTSQKETLCLFLQHFAYISTRCPRYTIKLILMVIYRECHRVTAINICIFNRLF